MIRRFFSFLLCCAFFVGGLWLVGVGTRDAWKAQQSATWPTTPGTITASAVQISHGRRGSSYTPHISYTYEVQGIHYPGTSITPGRMWKGTTAYTVAKEFPVGSHPPVSYSPGSPQQSVLIPGFHYYNLALVIFGLIPLTLAGTIAGCGLIARIYGIPPSPDGSYSMSNNKPGTVLFLLGFGAFIAEICLVIRM